MPGSLTAPGRPSTREIALRRVAFRCAYGVGTRDKVPIAAQWLAYAYPCQRFAPHLTMRHA
jgi:hypothetical protein